MFKVNNKDTRTRKTEGAVDFLFERLVSVSLR